MTDQINEQDQNLKDLLGFDPKDNGEGAVLPGKTSIPKDVQIKFSETVHYSFNDERIDPSRLLFVAKDGDMVIREYWAWSRNSETREVDLVPNIALRITDDGIAIDWPTDDSHGYTMHRNNTMVFFGANGVEINLRNEEGADPINIEWDSEGKLKNAGKWDYGLKFGDRQYDIPKHLDIQAVKDLRLPGPLVKDPFNAPSEFDIAWKTSSPLEFMGIKPA